MTVFQLSTFSALTEARQNRQSIAQESVGKFQRKKCVLETTGCSRQTDQGDSNMAEKHSFYISYLLKSDTSSTPLLSQNDNVWKYNIFKINIQLGLLLLWYTTLSYWNILPYYILLCGLTKTYWFTNNECSDAFCTIISWPGIKQAALCGRGEW